MQLVETVDSGRTGELDVHEDDVGLRAGEHFQRVAAGSADGRALHFRVRTQEFHQALTVLGAVFDHRDADRWRARVHGWPVQGGSSVDVAQSDECLMATSEIQKWRSQNQNERKT